LKKKTATTHKLTPRKKTNKTINKWGGTKEGKEETKGTSRGEKKPLPPAKKNFTQNERNAKTECRPVAWRRESGGGEGDPEGHEK